MNQWSNRACERLLDLVQLPTVAWEARFAGALPGWRVDRAGTFAQAEAYLANWLMAFADQVSTQDVLIDGRTLRNIWARVSGRDTSRGILLQGHYDVVALDGDFSPALSADGEHVTGRGTSDMKGGVVAALMALDDMVRSGQRPRLDTYVLLTCEEEVEARAIQEFLRQKPSWCDQLEFAISLEPCFWDDEYRLCTRHPGIACLAIGMDLAQDNVCDEWLCLRIETGQSTPHASREPIYLDPCYAMLRVLHRVSGAKVAWIRSDRPLEREVNALSAFVEALIAADVGESALETLARHEVTTVIDAIADGIRRKAAGDECTISVSQVTASQQGWDARDFADALLQLRSRATDKRYTNALYDRTPFTFAILDVKEGSAKAMIDLRTDRLLRTELEQLVAFMESDRRAVRIRWNDPGLEQPEIEASALYQGFLDVCRRHYPRTVPRAHSGWTEGAFLSEELGTPVVVAGPGQMDLAHQTRESISLKEMRTVYTILGEFLTQSG